MSLCAIVMPIHIRTHKRILLQFNAISSVGCVLVFWLMHEAVFRLKLLHEHLHPAKRRKWFINACRNWVCRVKKTVPWRNPTSHSINSMHFTIRFALEMILKIYFGRCKYIDLHFMLNNRFLVGLFYCAICTSIYVILFSSFFAEHKAKLSTSISTSSSIS